jgi:hypothetical protein
MLLAVFLSGFSLHRAGAQQRVSDVQVVVEDVRQEKDSVRAVLRIEMSGLSVASREQVYLFPVIRSDANEQKMLPVVIRGRNQHIITDRNERLSGKTEHVYAAFSTKGQKNFRGEVAYSAAIAFEPWMRDAHVAMVEERRDCRGDFHRFSVRIIADGIRLAEKPARTTVYELPASIPIPPREQIKTRSESGEAQIIYRVGNADIHPELGNNQSELNKIRNSIEQIRQVQGVKLNSITISSYASPEGSWQSNLNLSERRAASLTGWLRRNYDLSGIGLASRGYGEDWTGLVKLVEKDLVMTETEKSRVMAAIESTEVFDARDRLLMQQDGGRIYRHLLSNLYPLLRRSAYRIDFTVPEYTLETITEVYQTHPNMLSLYEFYLLANQYEPGSPQFREVIERASAMFPDEKINRISMAMFSYLSGNIAAALEYLNGLEDDPDAWLYFSVFHARNHELDIAEQYALKAQAAGNPDAAEHLRLIEGYKADEAAYLEKLMKWRKYNPGE